MSLEFCYLCNGKVVDWPCNLSEKTSQHSKTRLCIFLKNFLGDFQSSRSIDDETNCICVTCSNRIDEYDWLCEMVKQKEQELRDILLGTELFYVNRSSDENSNTEPVIKHKHDVLLSLSPETAENISLDFDEKHIEEIEINDDIDVKSDNSGDEDYQPTTRKIKTSLNSGRTKSTGNSGFSNNASTLKNDSNAGKPMNRQYSKELKKYACDDCDSTFNLRTELNVINCIDSFLRKN